jgi:hypothetical protein
MPIPEAGLDGVAVGFDCSHSSDHSPRDSHRAYGTYRDMKYVMEQTRSLAEQIAAYAPLQQLLSGTEEAQ